jgi:sterol desaturase/sphingolipid hydroxylase (fatty acid hydroxylase superfamily)
VRHALFPLVVAAMLAYALGSQSLDLASTLGLAAGANDALRPLSAIVLFYALIAALERLFPHRAEWRRSHGDVRTDVLHLLLTGTLAQALVGAAAVGPLSLLAATVAEAAGGALWPAGWPMLAQLGLAVVLGELGHYGFHRLSHESPLVWRLHATHHSPHRLYWLNATRFHVLDLFLIISFESLPLALLGAGAPVLAPYFVFRAIYGQLQHCNVDMPTPRWLDWLWSSPNVHRWHHSTLSSEGNHNYGAVLNVWDHAFRSFWRPDAPFAGPVGIGQLPRFPSGWLAQQLAPFRWARVR